MKNYFSINLDYIKRVNRLNNEDIRDITNLGLSTISKLINNKGEPNINTLLVLSKTFGYSVDDLLKIEIAKSNKFKQDVIEEKEVYSEKGKKDLEAAKTTILELKQQRDLDREQISDLKADKIVYRNQAEKYLEVISKQV